MVEVHGEFKIKVCFCLLSVKSGVNVVKVVDDEVKLRKMEKFDTHTPKTIDFRLKFDTLSLSLTHTFLVFITCGHKTPFSLAVADVGFSV